MLVPLAEANPDYPADAQAIIVVFDEVLTEYFETTDITGEIESQIPLSALADEYMPFYAFSEPRLESTGEQYTFTSLSEADGTEEERANSESASAGSTGPDSRAETDTGNEDGAAAVDALAERLANSGMRVVDRDSEGTLTVAKMRDTYRVESGRVIEGDGRSRQRLEQLVAGDGDTAEE